MIDNGSHKIRLGNCDMIEPYMMWENLLGTDKKTGSLIYGEDI